MRPVFAIGLSLLQLLQLLGTACGSEAGDRGHRITVFAAASLTDAFDAIGTAFHEDHPDVTVEFNYLASSDLAAQIEQGAPADVFASADEANMQRVVEKNPTIGTPEVFAHNDLSIIVPPGNPAGIQGLQDLGDADLVISICNEECPAGRYAREVFSRARVDVEADSLESEVKAVVTRVVVGEADAGIVYTTDVTAAGSSVERIPIPRGDNVVATYPVVAIDDSPAAGAFVDFVLSSKGQRILKRYDFLPK